MNKIKFLTLAIILLIILNIVTLVFFISKGPKDERGPRKPPQEIIIKKLHFSDQQVIEYKELINNHQKEITKLDDETKELKTFLYSQLSNSGKKTTLDSLFQEIANKQSEVEKIHFDHFLAIKKLCNEDQLKDYNELTKELAELFAKPKRENDKK